MSPVVGPVDHPLQPAADRLLGEGVHHQHQGRGREAALPGAAQRQQVRQEREDEAVEFQRQREQARQNEGGPDDDVDTEQVVGEHGVADGCQEQDGGEGADVDEGRLQLSGKIVR